MPGGFFDWVSKGVEKAKIPQYVWNCDNSDEYQPVYASVYGMATVPLNPIRLLVQAQFSILLQKDPQNVFLLQNIQDAEQVEVAVLCGIWNGLVDIVAGVPKMISMLASIGSSKGWDDIENIYVTMSDYKNPETGNVGITGALSDGVSTMFDPGKPCELAHNTSGIVVGVAICFINPTAIEGTFGQVIANVVKIVQRLDAFADALNPLSRISNFVLKSAGTAMQATLKNGKLIIKVAMRADEVFREVDWSLAKTAQMIGPDGRTYTVLMSNDPMDAARTAGRKLKEILDDEKGIPLTDANGNGLAKMEVTDADGKITEEVAVVKLGTEISEEAADLLTRLKNRLKNDYKWTDEEILAFEGDFKGDLELLRKFDGDQGLVDSWAVLKKTEIDELSGKVENLESLNKALKQDARYDADYFETLLKSKDDPQKFLNDYVSKIGENGKFADDALETDYTSYLSRKAREGKPPRDRADWNQASDYMKYNSPTARGNAFNDVGKAKYSFNEVNLKLSNGSNVRVDSYIPASQSPTGEGMIISRKATDLVDIKESTFRSHLQEMKDKYMPGTVIRSDKYPLLDGKSIEGKQYLEIPESNKSFYDIERYKSIAKDEYGIEIIFLAE